MRYPREEKDTTAGSCVWIPKWLPLCQFTVHRSRQQGIDVKQVSRTPMQVKCPPSKSVTIRPSRSVVRTLARKHEKDRKAKPMRNCDGKVHKPGKYVQFPDW